MIDRGPAHEGGDRIAVGDLAGAAQTVFQTRRPRKLELPGPVPTLSICQFFLKTARIVGVDPACFSISSKNL